MCAGGDQTKSVLHACSKVLADGLRRPGAFLHLVLEGVTQGQGALRGLGQPLLVQVGQVAVHQGHGVGHVGHVLPKIVRVHALHGAPQVLQFLPGRSGGGGHLVGGLLPLSAQVGKVFCGGDGPRAHRRQSRRHGGGYLVGGLLYGRQLLVGRFGAGPQGLVNFSRDFYGQFHDLAFWQFPAPPLPCRSVHPAAGPGTSPHRCAVGGIGQYSPF